MSYITVDIGGTNTRIAGADDLNSPVFSGEPIRRRNSTDYEADIAAIIEAAHQIGGSDIKGVGIGIVGDLNSERTVVLSARNNAHWNGKPFVEELSKALSCPVVADNDAVTAALGEAYYGAVKSDFAYVIWGTGIGGAMVVHDKDGKPGVNKLDWNKHFGEWEYSCGGKELAQTYGKQPEELSEADWQTILAKFSNHARHFVELAEPQAIVFGGGLSVRHKTELEGLSATIGVPCKVTDFDGDSGLYGGLALIRSKTD